MIDIELKHPGLAGGKMRYKHLLGRKFKQGETDCGDILRQFYLDNLGIKITNYARPNDWWLEDDVNPYLDNYASEGFYFLDDYAPSDLRPFDVMLIAIPDPRRSGKTITNHCAIYLGHGYILHHRYGQMSTVELYKGSLRHLTTHVARHKNVPDFTDQSVVKVDILDHVLPHKRERIKEILKNVGYQED